MNTAKVTLHSIKDSDQWSELIHTLYSAKFEKEFPELDEDAISDKIYEAGEGIFEYGEYASFTIEVDEDLNIVGGKIHRFKPSRD